MHISGNFALRILKEFKSTIPKTTNTHWNCDYWQLLAVSKLDLDNFELMLKKTKHKECVDAP